MLELEAVLAALRAYRDRCKGQPLKVAAVNRCIGIVRALPAGEGWLADKAAGK
jgi:hypothetical protein